MSGSRWTRTWTGWRSWMRRARRSGRTIHWRLPSERCWAGSGRRVSELVAAAPRYTIVKAKAPRGPALEPVYAALQRRFADAQADVQDGLRLAWRDRWLHVRPSNTEPIIRLIAEAPSGALARDLVDEGRRLCAAS